MANDDQHQLDIQSQINKVIEARAALMKNVTSEISAQVSMAQELCKALDCEDLEGMQERMDGFHEALNRAGDSARDMDSTLVDIGEAAEDSASSANNLVSELADIAPKATGAVGAMNAFKGVKTSLHGLWDTVSGLGSSLMNIGGAIMGAVSAGIGFLADKAMQAGNANVGFANAMNKLNAAFGESSAQAKNVRGAFDNIKSGSNAMGEAGVSLTAIYGRGPDGMAAALEDITELAKEMGTEFNKLGDDFEKNAGQYMLAYKGLGLSAEALANINKEAMAGGKKTSDVLKMQAKMVGHLSKEYGVSVKQMGKNLSEMAEAHETFGGMSQKQLTATAAFAAKLGVEIKSLASVTKKWDDFASAAEGASELAASFGMAIDTMDMMNADPAEKIGMLRDSFHAAGKSFADMSRQEKARLAELSGGLSTKELETMLDPANAGLSFDELEAAAQDAADGAITQEEANVMLAKSIEKLTEAFGGMTNVGGPLDAFLQGVTQGIMKSPQMREILNNFREVLMTIYNAGKEVGKMFMELFPGMEQFAGGFAELLNPEQWKAMMGDVVEAFREFFILLETDPEAAMDNLIEKIKTIFTDFFAGNEGSSMMQEGLQKMWGAIQGIVGWLAKKLAEFMAQIFDALMKSALFKKAATALGMFVGARFALGLAMAAGQAMFVEWLKNKFFPKGAADKIAKTAGKGVGGAVGEGAEDGVRSNKGIIEALKEITEKDIKKAFKIGMYLVAFVSIAMVALAGAFFLVSKILGALSVEEMVKGIVGLASALGATWVMIQFAKMMKKADIMKASMGMLAAAGMFLVSGYLYATGLKLMHGVLEGIPLLRMVEVMAMLGMALLATWGMILLGSLLVADGGVMMAMTALGMLAAGLLFLITAPIFGAGLVALHDTMAGIDLMRMIEVMAMLGMALLATWGMVMVGATLGSSLVAIGLALIGSLAAGALFVVMSTVLGAAMIEFYNAMSGIDATRMILLLSAMGQVLLMVTLFMPIAAALGLVAMASFGMGIAVVKKGFKVIGELASSMAESLVPAIETIGAMRIGDPTAFEKKMDAIFQIIEATEKFGDMAIKIAVLDTIATAEGGEAGAILEGAASFIDSMLGGMVDLIDAMVLMTNLIGEDDIGKLGAMGSLIASISTLMTSLQPPPALLEAMKPSYSVGMLGVSRQAPDVAGIMGAYGGAVVRIMKTMTKHLPPMLKSIMELDLGEDPCKAIQKMQAIAIAIDAIGKMAATMGGMAAEMMCIHENQRHWYSNDASMTDTMKTYNGAIVSIMKSMKQHIPEMLEVVIEAAKKIDNPEKALKSMEVVSKALTAVGSFASGIGSIASLIPEDDSWNPFADDPDRAAQLTNDIRDIVDAVKDAIPGLVEALLSVEIGNPQAAMGKLEVVSAVLERVAQFGRVIKGIGGDMGDAGGALAFAADATNAFDIVTTIITGHGKSMEGKSSMRDLVTAINDLPISRSTGTNLEIAGQMIEHVAQFINHSTAIMETISGTSSLAIGTAVGTAVDAYNAVSQELTRIDPINIDAIMSAVETGLQVNRDQITVQDNGLTIQLSLNVTMEADDLAEVLVEKKLVVAGTGMENQNPN